MKKRKTKVYVDGFMVEEIEAPSTIYLLHEHIKNSAAVQEIAQGKKIVDITPIPFDYPRFVLVFTELS